MRTSPDELQELAAVLTALRPYLPDLILVGGWAHRLFELHPWARDRDFERLRTNDVDFAIPHDVRTHDPAPIPALLEGAGFKVQPKSIHTVPPIVRYQKGRLLVEFIADLQGSPTRRDGKDKQVAELAGVTAEQLRYVYPLHLAPWSPTTEAGPDLAATRVANPVGYLFQKIIVHSRRFSTKAANDIVYISDTTDIFGDRLDALRDEWIKTVAGQIHPKHIATFRKAAEDLMVVKDVHRQAAKITEAIGRPRTAAELAAIVRLVVGTVFVAT